MRNDLWKKALVLGIILLFVGVSVVSGISENFITSNDVSFNTCNTQNDRRDVLDQEQLNITGWRVIGEAAPYGAQSFTPSLNILTRVALNIRASKNGGNVDVLIRKSLDGNNLTSISIPQSELPIQGLFYFDFPDIIVTPGALYYIVVHYNKGYLFSWGFSKLNLYPNGDAWIYEKGWHQDLNYADFCFQTYGMTSSSPLPPTITGPAAGKVRTSTAYNFTTTDPDNDDVSYYIDWGDNKNSGWIGPSPSGDQITESHKWLKKGTYTIKAKAKDTSGNESEWATLSVTMPCSYNIPLLPFWERLLERFPHVFPILRLIVGY
jgi:hypothetical protein